MRPMISAASARTRKSSESAEPIGSPIIPARRNSARNASIAGDRPHDRVQALHGDTEEAGPVGAIGGRADGDADGGPLQEQADAQHGDRRDDQHEEVVGVEHQRSTSKVKSNGGSMRWDRTFSPNGAGQEQAAEREQLGEAERGDGEHEPRRPEEPADDQQLTGGAERDRGRRSRRRTRGATGAPR